MSLKIDTSQFSRALRDYMQHTKKDLATVLNKKALDVAFKAAGQTPRGNASRIRKIQRESWWWVYVTKRLKDPKGVMSSRSKDAVRIGGGKYKWGDPTKAGKAIIASRIAALGYMRASWGEAVRKLAPHVQGAFAKLRGFKKKVKKGTAIPAREELRSFAQIENWAPGIAQVGAPALQNAINEVAADMDVYTARKLQETANKFNAK